MKITKTQLRKLIREQVEPGLDEDADNEHLYNSGFEDAVNERGVEHPYSAAFSHPDLASFSVICSRISLRTPFLN